MIKQTRSKKIKKGKAAEGSAIVEALGERVEHAADGSIQTVMNE